MRAVFIVGILIAIISYYLLTTQYHHFLLVLLVLETLTASLYTLLLATGRTFITLRWVLLFLSFAVCEAAVGLSLLVWYSRVNKNDYVFSRSLVRC